MEDFVMVDLEKYVSNFANMIDSKQRYASFDFCYSYFYRVHKLYKGKNEDKEKSCMVLWSYLASWGMLRGSSQLLQKSPASLLPLIDCIGNIYNEAIDIDVDKYDNNNIKILISHYNKIENCIKEDIGFIPSVTLVTKIMLGVFANVPAYDQYVKGTFKINTFNEKSLRRINKIYTQNKSNIDNLAQQIKVLVFPNIEEKITITYTKAKIIDMYGFQKGIDKQKIPSPTQ